MSISSTLPTSRRGYLSEDELEQLADITVTDSDEGSDRISQAEEIIDAYVGPQLKFLDYEITGLTSAGGSTSLTLETKHQNVYEADFFKFCEVEIIGGTAEGERKKITASTKAGVLTIDSAWTDTVDSTSYYRIYQLGKFPRKRDSQYYSDAAKYYKAIPEQVKRAVAAQVAYFIEMGDAFVHGAESEKTSERIGDYSYSKGDLKGGATRLIAPRAKLLLNGIINRTGQLVV